MNKKPRIFVWIGFIGAVLLVLGLKAWQLDWLQPKAPLELNDQPAVLVFVKYRYACECEGYVNGNARSQALHWLLNTNGDIPLHLIDIEQRSDLARRYQVIRAPSMLLLDADGEIVWRQDDVISDELPLDIEQINHQIAVFMGDPSIKN